MKLFPWRARPQTETTPIGSLTSWRAATASGSIRNFPFSSQYTSLMGLAGPVTGGAERDLDVDGERKKGGEESPPPSLPLLKNLSIFLFVLLAFWLGLLAASASVLCNLRLLLLIVEELFTCSAASLNFKSL
uniref:Uncharacterized protein n=1 Tax=Rhizophora mucronata TaxID=61149 RepID=A0A2P2JMW2_RHIMU